MPAGQLPGGGAATQLLPFQVVPPGQAHALPFQDWPPPHKGGIGLQLAPPHVREPELQVAAMLPM